MTSGKRDGTGPDGDGEAMPVEAALELAERVMAAEAAGAELEAALRAEPSADAAEASPDGAAASPAPAAEASGASAGEAGARAPREDRPAPRGDERGATRDDNRQAPRGDERRATRGDDRDRRFGGRGEDRGRSRGEDRGRSRGEDRGGRPRGDDRGARRQDERGPPAITDARKVRSPFGTRVARKIVCGVCAAEDTIHFAPREGQTPMCRRCAAERLGVVDRDANIAPENREKCERCAMWVVRPCQHEDPLDCPEHARAIALRQPDRSRTGTRSKKNVIRVRRK